MREPAVFLFDEPLSNLDAKLRAQMRLEIRKLHRRLATTSLYVTHDQVEAMTLAHRVVVMNAGRAEQIGTPEEIYARPATTYVAGFMGSPPMNLISRTVSDRGDSLLLDDATVALPTAHADLAGRGVTLGVRPEHLCIGPTGTEADVELVEALGADRLVNLSVGPASLVVRTQDTSPEIGSRVDVALDAHQLHWFDRASGTRIDRSSKSSLP